MGEKKVAAAGTEVLVSQADGSIIIRYREWDTSGPQPRLSDTYSNLYVTQKTAAILLAQLESAVPLSARISGNVVRDEVSLAPSDDPKKVN